MKKTNSIEEYIESNAHFSEALEVLREIINSTELEETLKWNAPVYALNGKNVVGIGAFKNHFGLWFFNGVFLKDKNNLLEQAQEKTKGIRQMRFESIDDIDKHAVLAYVKEAIDNQKLGKEIKTEKKGKTIVIPKELQITLETNINFQAAFKALTPGKQREYCEHIASAKQEKTKMSRLEKIKPMILKGVGLNDKYKNC
ncbi:MAG TPA: DUF1801 domain-containing protein [Xanthomarina sp.]|nr:DUF1801 domain-containing protein [Xanthomarina sp.]